VRHARSGRARPETTNIVHPYKNRDKIKKFYFFAVKCLTKKGGTAILDTRIEFFEGEVKL